MAELVAVVFEYFGGKPTLEAPGGRGFSLRARAPDLLQLVGRA